MEMEGGGLQPTWWPASGLVFVGWQVCDAASVGKASLRDLARGFTALVETALCTSLAVCVASVGWLLAKGIVDIL